MCGFICAFSTDEAVNPQALSRGLKNIQHRGPDESRHWISADGKIALGHARLSIIDLEGGQQPLSSSDGSIKAVVNGEFYDYKMIRASLEDWGYNFKTHSDSEILLGLYQRYGTRCLQYLRGEFAFVLWDEKNGVIFAGRDRFGIKPLYYKAHQGTLYFSSEIKGLLPFGIPLQWDEGSLYQELGILHINNTSPFKGVYQVPPGHFYLKPLKSDAPQVVRYWDFPYQNHEQHKAQDRRSEGEIIQSFKEHFEEAVRLRLVADVKVGCYLSGGLDSCAVLGWAQQMSSRPIEAFTLTFDDDLYNEAKEAEEMARFAGANYHPIPISQEHIADHFEDALWTAERFFVNGHGVAKYLLSRAVHQAGMKVVLTGEGSDEIFAGYAHFREDYIKHHLNHLPLEERENLYKELAEKNKASQGLLFSGDELAEAEVIRNQLGFVPSWMNSGMRTAKLLHSMMGDHAPQRPLAQMFLGSFGNMEQLRQWDPVHTSLYLWSKSFLPSYLLTVLGDRMEMAHSIEGRLPFLDHNLVEFVAGVPSHFKIKGMVEKYLLREGSKDLLTKTIYERQKHPFLAPPALLDKKNKMSQLIHDTLRGSELQGLGLFDQKRVLQKLDELPQLEVGEQSRLDIIFNLLTSACLMNKRFVTKQ